MHRPEVRPLLPEVPEVLVQDRPFLLAKVVPVRMVRDNLYSTSLQAAHISSLTTHEQAHSAYLRGPNLSKVLKFF